MRIEIRKLHIALDRDAVNRIRDRFERALDRFAQHILHGRILLSDANGPKGGPDKHCLVELRLRRTAGIVIKEEGVELFSVIDRASGRLAMAVSRAVDRVRRGGVRQVRRQRFACTGAQLAPDDLLM